MEIVIDIVGSAVYLVMLGTFIAYARWSYRNK